MKLLFLLALFSVQMSGAAMAESHTESHVAKSPVAESPSMKMTTAPSTQRAAKLQLQVEVSGAFVAAAPPVARQTAAYFTLNNTGRDTVTLTGVSSSAAGRSMLMTFGRSQAGLLSMKMVAAFSVKPGQHLSLSPTGAHVMLSDLKRPLQVGEKIELTLHFAGGSTLTVLAPVQRF